jgi:hypothetical protein
MRVSLRRMPRALLAVGILVVVGAVRGGELVPYAPPSVETGPRTVKPVRSPEDTYDRFKLKIRGLVPAERQALAQSFETKRVTAARAGDLAGEQHYRRLLDILRTETY